MKENKYVQIYNDIKKDIVEGVLKTGDKLMSKRDMSISSNVSIITVEHAYELLEEEGYITSKERSGYFVSFSDEMYGINNTVNSEVHILDDLKTDDDNYERFRFGIYAKTIRTVINEYGDKLLDKQENRGCRYLREVLCGYLGKNRHIFTEPDRIFIGSGAEYLYGLIIQALGRNRIFGIESPSYSKIEQVYNANNVTYRMLTLHNDGIDCNSLNESDVDVLHITPYRSFPSGVSATAYKKREYIKWSKEKDGLILEDDVESEINGPGRSEETLYSISEGKRVIYMNTFSRTISPALRIAYMVIPEDLIDLFDNKVGFYSCTVPTLEQYAVAKLIENGDFERHINRMRRVKK